MDTGAPMDTAESAKVRCCEVICLPPHRNLKKLGSMEKKYKNHNENFKWGVAGELPLGNK